jgi:hypothetical protein
MDNRAREMTNYAIDLSRIIEDLCKNRPTIRKPQTAALHHYEMALKHAKERALMEAVIGAANSRWQTHESNHILDDCLIALNDYRNTSKGEDA